MCGIFALLCDSECRHGADCRLRQLDLSQQLWCHRGPDGLASLAVDQRLLLAGCVLHQRGDRARLQPVERLDGGRRRVLLWNGELFYCTDPRVDLAGSDTEAVSRLLHQCLSLDELLVALGCLGGPHAFFYYASDLSLILFGRDLLGRRSLLLTEADGRHLVWSSVALDQSASGDDSWAWTEVPACGVFSLSLAPPSESTAPPVLMLHPYDLYSDDGNEATPPSLCGRPVSLSSRTGVRRFVIDTEAVRRPPDAVAAAAAAEEQQQPQPLDAPPWLAAEVDTFERLLSDSVACRVQLCSSPYPPPAPTELSKVQPLWIRQSSIAVLFSGGVDSTLVAALAARHAPPQQSIDLLNVAFEQAPPKPNPTLAKARDKNRGKKSQHSRGTDPQDSGGGFNVPDRLTGIESLAELRHLLPGRHFNFVTIDVTLKELQEARTQRISQLCSPCLTVLDDSLGCAVWFAARGEGFLTPELNRHLQLAQQVTYRSPSKVILCGMGADELLCGYSRHRYIYSQHGYPAVAAEVSMEIKRIAQRNLGRDDRMVADHGREARFPYLDERLVAYLANLPPWKKADLSRDRGQGEKLLLRCCAARLGLALAAVRPKRAMQFGSRIAKCENRRERGDQACDRLRPAGGHKEAAG
ncbi:hypothetical protein BOX15_Mlig014159g1 [Macrostomum lignano]|uniref:Glutamine amidotransferase type-2 domain-containing protein n=1 Tax=Macrostomum lignano TaxID=282301 RepID=A0A267GRF9_9PLAT|nr:hypothetical protein BOX15_Mlig014159g1 [Macrostomum lignano]